MSDGIKVTITNTEEMNPKPMTALPRNNPGAKGGAEAHVEVIKPYSP